LIERNRCASISRKFAASPPHKRHLVFPPAGKIIRVIDIVKKGSIALRGTEASRARGARFDGGAHVVG